MISKPQGQKLCWMAHTWYTEFAGTLLGFDDYVSQYSRAIAAPQARMLTQVKDMVLEDVTEL